MRRAHANAITNAERVERHLTPPSPRLSASYSGGVLCTRAPSYVFLCLTYMQLCLDAPYRSCIANIANVMSRDGFFQEVRRDSFLSLRRQSLGTVKPGTSQFTLADYFEVSQEASFNLSFRCFSRSSVMANVINLHEMMHEGRRSCLNAKVRLALVL